MSRSSRRTLAVVDMLETRPGRERYQSLVDLLNASTIERARADGWDVIRLAAGDLGEQALLRRADAADAIVLMGGEDISPRFYGGSSDYPGSGLHDETADAAQIALVRRTVDRGTPLLGICRGSQLLNVALGGTLVQHLGDGTIHKDLEAPVGVMATHDIRIDAASRLGADRDPHLGSAHNSHHQAVDVLGDGLRAIAHAPDGVVEAIEHDTAPVFAVQWHPEHPSAPAWHLTELLGHLRAALEPRLLRVAS